MALSNINIVNVGTVQQNYSWDDGIPSASITVTPDASNTFTCYAPYACVTVKSNLTNESTTIGTVSAIRTINFEDYYNELDDNLATFKPIAPLLVSSPNTQYDVSLNALSTNDIETVGFFHTYLMPGTYKIKLKTSLFNETEEAKLSTIKNGVYIQQAAINKDVVLEKQVSTETPGTTRTVIVPVTEISEEITCQGTITVVEIFPTINSVSQVDYTGSSSTQDPFLQSQTTRKRLSVKDSKAGSFPIERVVWEMNDGTTYEQVRWNITTDPLKYIQNDWYTNDPYDPRKYDVIHDFVVNPDKPDEPYTAKVTIYAANTGSSASTTISIPKKIYTSQTNIDPNQIELIKCELTDTGKVFVGKIENSLVMWSTDK